MNRSLVQLLLLAFCAATVARAYKEVPPPEKIVLPPSKSPAESQASLRAPANLKLELVAAEPLVMDPIDVAWGPDGKMWVVEMADYPLGIDGQGKPGGRIRFLESTKSDGTYDQSTLFADGLAYPTTVLPWRNGILVVAAPDILFLQDTDGDGRADRTEKIFTGIGLGNPQHLVNGLQWGLDGWLRMANGNSGAKVSSPRASGALDVGQRDFRISPDDGRVEVLSGQSQTGRNRDDWGNWFGCNNSNPIWHYALDEHYLRRNPHLVPPSGTVTVSNTPGAQRVFPVSETLARFNDPNGANHITSACGVMVYRDNFLGAEYAGNVFVCEPVHNLVHREIMRPAGATFTSERAPQEQTSEFLASADNWSRFVSVRTGPDGALYIVDMYRLVIEHPKWIPDAWQKQLGNKLRAGDDQGRIYRLRPKDGSLRRVPRLDQADARGLVAALDTPNGVVRDLVQQQLVWRKETAAVPALESVVAESKRAETRVQALCTLDLMGALTPNVVERALRDPYPGVRRQALRVSEPFAKSAPELLGAVAARVDDDDAMVRQQAGYTLGEWPQPAAAVALAKLLHRDDDRFIRAAVMSSALPHASALIAQLSTEGAPDAPALIDLAIATNNVPALGRILAAIAGAAGGTERLKQFTALARVLDGLQRNNTSLAQLQPAEEAAVEPLGSADQVFGVARKVADDGRAAVVERIAAVQVLGRGRTLQNEDVQELIALLAPRNAVELQLAAVAALGRINKPTIPTKLLAGWNGYGRAVRTAVLDLIISRTNWANLLLDRAEADPAMRAEIDAGRRLALVQHSNATLAARAAGIFNGAVDANRQKVIDQYLGAVKSRQGDPKKGGEVFAAICSACHKFGDVPGRLIGPDIAAVKDRSPDYLVTHILDPNRAVEDKYVLYTATTQDGRALAGMLAGESGNSITFLGLDGAEQVILRSELKSLSSTSRSLMPDGLEGAINEQAMADLIAFLGAGR